MNFFEFSHFSRYSGIKERFCANNTFEKASRKECIFTEANKSSTPGEKLLCEIYKNANMGEDSLCSLIGKVKDDNLRRDITYQLDTYAGYANTAKSKLAEMNVKAKELSPFAKISSEISMAMSTMTDSSAPKLAELIIEGSTMGIVKLKKQITAAKRENAPEHIMNFANEVVTFEENSINKMKEYL